MGASERVCVGPDQPGRRQPHRGPRRPRRGDDRRDSVLVTRGLADTSVFIARESGRPLDAHSLPEELAVSIITIAELRAGVLVAATVEARDRRLGTLTAALGMDPVPVDDAVAAAWARLRVLLRETGQRMPINDSWIAATAMSLKVPVVTQDDDFPDVEGLSITRV
ncbi:MAG TPA: type II toxin-antitoxin system VapC family toxin [Acidimicrobiales bacterium]|nr:type II toxin-antitoxin system VapC family toxin [Acidimicrobiales bacterium]